MPQSTRSFTIAWLRCIVLFPLLGGIAAACSSGAPSVSPTVRPEVLDVPEVTLIAAATPAPTLPAYPIATPAPEPTPQLPPPFPSIQLAQRVDSLHGWAMVAHQLRWTDDDGAHWRTIAVPITERQSIANAFFLDTHSGWLLVAGPHDPDRHTAQFSVLRTNDSGATWQAFPLAHYTNCFNCIDRGWGSIVSGVQDSLMFLNAREGWAQIDRTETMNSYNADLFHTTDGGSTWQKLSNIFASGAFSFHTPRAGWQLGACCTGAPAQLQQTHDGGRSWQMVEFHDAPDYEAIALPTFFDAATGVVSVAIPDAQQQYTTQIAFYITDDGGQTWRANTSFEPQPARSFAFPLGLLVFQAIDRNAWRLGVYQTANGGQSWRTLSSPAESPDFIRFMFADDQQGWGIALKSGCGGSCALLMRTHDGGYGWEVIDVDR